MANDQVTQRIAAWESAGLIDGETANRLRAAEAAVQSQPDGAGRRTSGVGSWFGPIPSVAELFGYVGAGFLLAAWHTLSLSSGRGSNVTEWLVPAIVFGLAGVALARRSDRERRAAGVSFAVATGHVFGAATQLLDVSGTGSELMLTISAAIAVGAALGFRRAHPAVLTELGLLGALATFAGVAILWLGVVLFPAVAEQTYQYSPPPDPNAMLKVVLRLAWWLAWAVGFGLLGLWEAAAARREAAGDDGERTSSPGSRLASVARFVAGLTAVLGATSVITTSTIDEYGDYGRVLAPWIGDGVILAIGLVLLGLAIRRGAAAYLYPAALGVIVAFSDLNAQYVAERTGTGVALLVEGLILIGAGLLAERLRRRLGPASLPPPAPQPGAPTSG